MEEIDGNKNSFKKLSEVFFFPVLPFPCLLDVKFRFCKSFTSILVSGVESRGILFLTPFKYFRNIIVKKISSEILDLHCQK